MERPFALRRTGVMRPALVIAGLMVCATFPLYGQICTETPAPPTSLGSPSGCDLCLYYALPGTLEASPATRHYIESDLPEKLLATGVLYATTSVLPADRNGYPILSMRTQTAAGGFVSIDDDFDTLIWHTSSPGDGTQPRRIVVYVRNDGTGSVQITPQQIMVTDGAYTTKSNTLGQRVLEDNWDTTVAPLVLAPGTGDVIAYGKRFAASTTTSDTSTGVDCFGRVRALVQNSDPNVHPTQLTAYVVAIDGANVSQNKSRAEALLTTGATSGDPFDCNSPPTGCANRRATGVFDTFVWRNQPLTIDAAALPTAGYRFRMALGQTNTQTCPAGRQTADLTLRPGFVRPDTVGNYMADYRVTLRFINKDAVLPRAVDVLFTQASASVGLAWQLVTGTTAATDAEVDAQSVRTGWAGPNVTLPSRSFLESDGGPLVIPPCGERYISLHFLILGGSSLPFEISVVPSVPSEYIVDNADSGFAVTGTWSTSAQSGCYGVDSLVHIGNAGLDKATWTLNLVSSGHYDVYAWWVAASNRATAAPYDIHYLTGTTRVTVDQTTGGSAWNLLGSFDFAAGGNPAVELTDDVPSDKYVSADAVRLVRTAAIERIVDNRDAGFSTVGTWPTSANSGYYGTDSQYHIGDGGASYCTWTASLPYTGRYRVHGWWVVASNRAPQAPYTVHHVGGTTTVYVNQTDANTASRWNALGDFDFDSGMAASVVLSAAIPTNQYVSADAVWFEFLSLPDTTAPAPPTGLTTTGSSGTVSLAWDDNGEADLAGYNVYRAGVSGGPYGKLNPSLLSLNALDDLAVIDCTPYFYVVTAVDTSSNESGNSAEVSAHPPMPGRPGDLTADGLVNSTDFLSLDDCLAGPGNGLASSTCVSVDMDCDDDADLEDLVYFQIGFETGG